MELDPLTWFSSLAGVSLATWLIIDIIKRTFANVAIAKAVPIWVYAVVVSGGLTWLANSFLGTLEGELRVLIAQAIMSALMASGGREWAITATKSLESSVDGSAARSFISGSKLRVLLPFALVVGLGGGSLLWVGCAGKTGARLAAGGKVSYNAITTIHDRINEDCGDTPFEGAKYAPTTCQFLNQQIAPVLRAQIAYNEALLDQRLDSAAAFVSALNSFVQSLGRVEPAELRTMLIGEARRALAGLLVP